MFACKKKENYSLWIVAASRIPSLISYLFVSLANSQLPRFNEERANNILEGNILNVRSCFNTLPVHLTRHWEWYCGKYHCLFDRQTSQGLELSWCMKKWQSSWWWENDQGPVQLWPKGICPPVSHQYMAAHHDIKGIKYIDFWNEELRTTYSWRTYF